MTPEKLTDEQIIRALECHIKRQCWNDCPNNTEERQLLNKPCSQIIAEDALNLINRLKADNERLEKAFENVNDKLINICDNIDKTTTEAYKEFAEDVKNEIISDTAYGCDSNQNSGYYDYSIKIGDIPEYIDDVLKRKAND